MQAKQGINNMLCTSNEKLLWILWKTWLIHIVIKSSIWLWYKIRIRKHLGENYVKLKLYQYSVKRLHLYFYFIETNGKHEFMQINIWTYNQIPHTDLWDKIQNDFVIKSKIIIDSHFTQTSIILHCLFQVGVPVYSFHAISTIC